MKTPTQELVEFVAANGLTKSTALDFLASRGIPVATVPSGMSPISPEKAEGHYAIAGVAELIRQPHQIAAHLLRPDVWVADLKADRWVKKMTPVWLVGGHDPCPEEEIARMKAWAEQFDDPDDIWEVAGEKFEAVVAALGENPAWVDWRV